MMVRTALRRLAAGHRKPFQPSPNGTTGRRRATALAALTIAGLLSACDVPVPDSALLRPLPAPRCEQHSAARSDPKTADAKAGDDAEALRAKLDYERQCYRHAELIARGKLRNLQESVSRTMVALKAQLNAQPHQTVGP